MAYNSAVGRAEVGLAVPCEPPTVVAACIWFTPAARR